MPFIVWSSQDQGDSALCRQSVGKISGERGTTEVGSDARVVVVNKCQSRVAQYANAASRGSRDAERRVRGPGQSDGVRGGKDESQGEASSLCTDARECRNGPRIAKVSLKITL